MLRVGLTGGYATGKSFVAHEMERLGCHVIYADKLGHRVLERGGEAYAPVVALFGNEVLDPATGEISRKALAALVFPSPERLQQLSAIVHPAVFRLEDALLQEVEAEDPNGIAVLEAAILIEHGRQHNFQKLVLTHCREEEQIRRGMRRDNLSREEAERRIEAQLPFEEKRKWADYVIETGGTKEDTTRQVEGLVNDLKRQAQAA